MVAMLGAELFRCGKWRGRDFTESHLDEIVNNFNRFQSPGPHRLHRVSMVKGHRAEDLQESSIPKHGTVNRLYREGPVLKYDAENVDPELAKDITDGRFEDLSAEIYDSPPEGIPGKGKMLRRIAVLGGDVPKVKGLNPNGLAGTLQYAERAERPTIEITRYSNRHGVYETFSERVPVSRDEMIARLVEMGMTVEVLNTLDDVQLQEIVKTAAGQGSATLDSTPSVVKDGQQPKPTGDETVADENKDSLKDESKEKPVVGKTVTSDDDDVGDDKEKSAKKYSEMSAKCKSYAEKHKAKFGAALAGFSEGATGVPGAVGNGGVTGAPVPVTFSEDQIKIVLADVIAQGQAKVAEMFSEAKTKIDAEIEANKKTLAANKAEVKRQRIEYFCEAEKITGRLEPADFDRGRGPNIVDRLLLLDDATVVHKFTEDGEERGLTALDAELRAIRLRTPKYKSGAEKISSDMPKRVETFAEGSKEQREAAFVAFAESQEERFRRTETTPKDIIAAWKIAPNEAARRDLEKELGFTGA